LNWRLPTEALLEKVRLVVFDAPKVAVAVGTADGDQFAAVLQLLDPGLEDHVAFCASAATVPSHTPTRSIRARPRNLRDLPGLSLAFSSVAIQMATAQTETKKDRGMWN
jgi:hypothetical protein